MIIKEFFYSEDQFIYYNRFYQKVMEVEEQKIQTDPLFYMNGVSRNWVNQETWQFISNLTFNRYVLAGNSIANMIAKIPLQGDLDFWAQDEESFITAMDEITPFYQKICIYPSMVQMTNDKGNLPKINLIYTNLNPNGTIRRFDFDYCRCYWTPTIGVHCSQECKRSIQTKIIRHPQIIQRVMRKRILKAIKYGYIFLNDFWQYFPDLIKNRNAVVITERRGWIQHPKPHIIQFQDLKLQKFVLTQIKIQVTNKYDVENTLTEITEQYQTISEEQNVKLPILLTLKGKQKDDLLHQYIQSIVLQNPLSDTQYLQVKIGLNVVNCQGRKTYQQRRFSSAQSSDDSFSQQQKQQDKIEKKQSSQKSENLFTANYIQDQFSKNTVKKIIHTNKRDTRLINLNEDGTAFVRIDYLPQNLEQLAFDTFSQMYELHPQKRHKIIMYQKEVQVSRFSQSYLYTPTNLDHTKTRSYMYSGYDTSSNKSPLPKPFEPFYKYMKIIDEKYNQVIANWYQNQNDYIAPHSDCQRGMTEEKKVAILSLYPNKKVQNIRILQITPKNNKNYLAHKFIISLDHGTIVTMCGQTQDEFVHGIAKQNRKCSPRISLSFRQMKQQ